jgi:hypothetical protein
VKFLSFGFLMLALFQSPPRSAIHARIVDELTGHVVPRVRYTLSSPALPSPVTGTGDDRGEISLSEVPSGTYRLTFEKAAYFSEPVSLNVQATSIDLRDVLLTAKREISGTVRWQDGEPAARAPIRILGVRGGKPIPRDDIQAGTTNDRGEFVISNLRPGRYTLLVSPPVQTGGIDALGRQVAGGIPRLGLPVYQRSTLDVRQVANIRDVSVILEEKPGTLIEGTVLPSAAAPAGTNVLLNLNDGRLSSFSTLARAGDAFRIGPVPSGFYVLDANSQGQNPSRTLLSLTVGGTILSGVAVSLPQPVVLSGKVEIDDPSVRPTVGIRIQSDKIDGTLGTTAADTGEFRIAQTVAGEYYNLTVTSLPSNAYLASVSQYGRELDMSPFPVAAGGDSVRIVLKTDGGTLQGMAKQNGTGVDKAFVVLAPKDRRLSQNFRAVNANRDGAFRLSAIPPGDYDLFAFDRNEDDDYLDETFLQRFSDRAVEIKVQSRSNASIDVHVSGVR